MSEENIKIELYRLYVGTIEKTSTRRIQTNNFFIAILGAILTSFSFFIRSEIMTSGQKLSLKLLALFSVILCFIWFFSIRYYKQLNNAKFKALDELEKDLPYHLFRREWKFFKKKRFSKWLTSSRIESIIPLVIMLPFIGIIIFLGCL